VAALALALLAGTASASKQVVDYFGTESGSGTLGGQFSGPQGIAVNQSGAGAGNKGDVYVVDGFFDGTGLRPSNRVERFSRDDNGTPAVPGDDSYAFISAWGTGVLTGGTDYEICTVASSCRAGVSSGANGALATLGQTGDLGAHPEGIAVDQDTGDVYVSDAANYRVNVYAGDGTFLRSFGYDVVHSGPGQAAGPDAEQQLTVKASGGKFSLSFKGRSTGPRGSGVRKKGIKFITGVNTSEGAFAVGQGISGSGIPAGTTITKVEGGELTLSQPATAAGSVSLFGHDLPYNASATEVESALNALPSIGGAGGSVTVTGGPGDASGSSPYTIHFGGTLSGEDVPLIETSSGGLTNGTYTAALAGATGGTFGLNINGEPGSGPIALNASAATVQAALEAVPSVGAGNASVSGPTGGPWAIQLAPAVAGGISKFRVTTSALTGPDPSATMTPPAGVTSLVSGGAYEVCDAAAGDTCKAGSSGDGNGEVGDSGDNTAPSITVSPADGSPASGTVFLADSGNHRINTYNLDGSSPSSFGAAVFAHREAILPQPRRITVDSRGIVYASNSTGPPSDLHRTVERYDSLNANGGGVGFLAPITAGVNETQLVKVSASAGQFRLSFGGETTADIDFASLTELQAAAEVRAALEALPAIGAGNVSVNGGPGNAAGSSPYEVHFIGALSVKDVEQLSGSNGTTPLSGGSGISVSTETPGVTGALPPAGAERLAVDPDSDGAGPDADVLYVLNESGTVFQLGPTNAPGLTAAPGAADDIHVGGFGFAGSGGLALDESDGRLYVSGVGFAGQEAHGVYIFGNPSGPASATLDSVDGITATAATVHATVNPNGPPATKYHLEYSLDGSKWIPTAEVRLGAQESPQAVDVTLSPPGGGFEPSTLYHVRMIVSKPFKPVITTPELTFTTLAAAPLAETVGAPVRTTTSAQLGGRVTPRNTPTTYSFEYGTQGPCDANPCEATAALSVGSGDFTELVSEEVQGLQPDTTYHYRLVANNGNPGSPTYGADMSVTTRASEAPLSHGHFPGPPGSDRAWEQVNAPNTGGNPVMAGAEISDDGTRTVYGVTGGTPSSETGAFNQFFAERTASGWQTKDNYPRRSEIPASSWATPLGRADLSKFFTVNFEFGGTVAVFGISPDGPPAKHYEGALGTLSFFSASDDGSRAIVGMEGSPDPVHPVSSGRNLYDVTSGAPQLVSLLPDGAVSACGIGGNREFDQLGTTRRTHWISPDGNTLFFMSSANNCGGPLQLYIRNLQSEETKLASGPPLSGPDCGGQFIKSTPGAAFFWSRSRLAANDVAPGTCSDGSTDGDVYRYSTADGTLDCVTCVVPGIAANVRLAVEGNGENVRERIAVAEDGSRVYFRSLNRLLPGARTPGVYRVEVGSGDLAYVGAISPFNSDVVEFGNALTPDGSVLVFRSDGSTLNPLGGSNNGGTQQYYRYDDRDRSLTCISCPADGSAPRGGARNPAAIAVGPNQTPLAADGNTIAFTTPTALVPIDQNTAAPGQSADRGMDAYEWRDGRLLLVSDGLTNWAGSNSVPSVEGITPSGKDILFSAAAPYTPDALDDYQRLYDAKIGGGIEFPKPPPPCPLEVCQGTPKGAPEEAAPGTGSFAGQGNAKPKRASHKKKHKKRHRKAHKKASQQRANDNRRTAR
jgi:hypothetical protein